MPDPAPRLPKGRRMLLLIDRFLEQHQLGGTERNLRAIIQALQSQEVTVKVCLLSGKPWHAEPLLGCPVNFAEVSSFLRTRDLQNLRKLYVWIKGERFDAMQTFFRESSWVGPWLGKLAGVPLIIGSRRSLKPWDTAG